MERGNGKEKIEEKEKQHDVVRLPTVSRKKGHGSQTGERRETGYNDR